MTVVSNRRSYTACGWADLTLSNIGQTLAPVGHCTTALFIKGKKPKGTTWQPENMDSGRTKNTLGYIYSLKYYTSGNMNK